MAGRTNGFDPQVATAALDERITNMSGRVNALDASMTRGFTSLETQLEALSNKFADSRRPQWQAISVALGVIALLGGFAYWPINSSLSDVKVAVMKLSDESLSPEERAYRVSRNTEDRATAVKALDTIKADIDALRSSAVPMSQWTEQIHGRDVQIADLQTRIDAAIDDMRRQIDANTASLSAVYSPRDVIMDLRNQLTELRKRVEGQEAMP